MSDHHGNEGDTPGTPPSDSGRRSPPESPHTRGDSRGDASSGGTLSRGDGRAESAADLHGSDGNNSTYGNGNGNGNGESNNDFDSLPVPEAEAIDMFDGGRGQANDDAITDESNTLQLEWCFGFNKDVLGGVHNLTDGKRSAMLYLSAHTAVVYDFGTHKQHLLQGHCNAIVCASVSEDKRWIVTADAGEDSVIIVWDALTLEPVRTIFQPHPNGTLSVDVSRDGSQVVSLSNDSPQQISIWDWAADGDDGEASRPLHSATVDAREDVQTCVRFNPGDRTELVTNGSSRVVFWSVADGTFRRHSPAASNREVKQAVSNFTQTMFLPTTTAAVSATGDGDLVLWDYGLVKGTAPARFGDRRAVKVIRVHQDAAVNVITCSDEYLLTGGSDGFVRCYDFQLRLIAWFEDLGAGAVTSISFAFKERRAASGLFIKQREEERRTDEDFDVPDFLVATDNALVVLCKAQMFHELEAENRQGELILQGQDAPLHGLAAHPKLPLFAVTGYSGMLHVWNYLEKNLIRLRQFDKILGQCLAYDPAGELLAIGCTNGTLKLVTADLLEDVQTFKQSADCVTEVVFSPDSQWIACADADMCVSLFRFTHRNEDPSKPLEWVYIGKFRGHYRAVTGLVFAQDRAAQGGSGSSRLRLFSAGEDRVLQEYDLEGSHITTGLVTLETSRIEQTAVPTAAVLLTPSDLGSAAASSAVVLSDTPGGASGQPPANDILLLANDQYKFKTRSLANPARHLQTVLAPTFGGPVSALRVLPGDGASRYMAFTTHDRIIGLCKLMVDGNLNRYVGLVGHPGEVTGMAVSCDGRFVFTCGGSDLAVNMWEVDTAPLEYLFKRGGHPPDPFDAQVEGGRGGPLYREIIDYFYYAQLRAQGESATAPRHVDGRVPLSQVPSLCRALGFYPSETECDELTAELMRFSEQEYHEARARGDGVRRAVSGQAEDTRGTVTLQGFVRAYVNHRPLYGIGKEHIAEAFAALGADEATGRLDRDQLVRALESIGEPLDSDTLTRAMSMLIEGGPPPVVPATGVIEKMVPEGVTARDFAEEILGFEDYGE